MKINQEGPGRMVLKDYNITHFVGGVIVIILGIFVALYMGESELLIMGVGGLFALVGLYVILTTKIINITLDKTGPCRFSMKKLIGGEATECNVSDIKELKLEKTFTKSGGKSKKTYHQYSIEFILKDGRGLRFDFGKVSAGITDVLRSPDTQKKAEAKQIADFLGVPLTEIGPPSAAETLGMMKSTIEEQMEKARRERGTE